MYIYIIIRTVQVINSFVHSETHNLISHVIDKVNVNDLMYVINVLYSKVEWEKKFDKSVDRPFYYFDKFQTKKPLMYLSEFISYADIGIAQTCLLRLMDQRVGMLVILPKDKTERGLVECVEHVFNNDGIRLIMSQLQHVEVSLALPKFRLSFSTSLREAFIAMGAPSAFCENANFFHMVSKETAVKNGVKNIYINDVIHRTLMDVNEEGVEAVGATCVKTSGLNMCPNLSQKIVMGVDRPFGVALVDVVKNLVFFTGVISHP